MGRLNRRQKLGLWLGTIVFSFLTIRPPWRGTWVNLGGHVRGETTLGSHFVWHNFGSVATYVRPDFNRLILELSAVIAITLALILTLGGQSSWHMAWFAKLRKQDPIAGRSVRRKVAYFLGLTSVLIVLGIATLIRLDRSNESKVLVMPQIGIARIEDIEDESPVGTASLSDIEDETPPEVKQAIASVPRPRFKPPQPDFAQRVLDTAACNSN
jgi:hypothetical protein